MDSEPSSLPENSGDAAREQQCITGQDGPHPDPLDIRATAEGYYRSGQFFCSEAIVKAVNDGFSLGYPESVIRLASGLPIGIGGAGCSCGAVTGGVIALGMVFGRDRPHDPRVDRCLGLARELHTFFIKKHGCICCRTLTLGLRLKSAEHMRQCVAFTGDVAEEVARMILRETADRSE